MPNVADTRLENAVTAIEGMAHTQAVLTWARTMTPEQKAAMLVTARDNLSQALREFLIPAVRLIDGGARQDYPEEWTEGNRPKCDVCKRHYICADQNCSQWAKAVAVKRAEKGPEKIEPVKPDGPEAA